MKIVEIRKNDASFSSTNVLYIYDNCVHHIAYTYELRPKTLLYGNGNEPDIQYEPHKNETNSYLIATFKSIRCAHTHTLYSRSQYVFSFSVHFASSFVFFCFEMSAYVMILKMKRKRWKKQEKKRRFLELVKM